MPKKTPTCTLALVKIKKLLYTGVAGMWTILYEGFRVRIKINVSDLIDVLGAILVFKSLFIRYNSPRPKRPSKRRTMLYFCKKKSKTTKAEVIEWNVI